MDAKANELKRITPRSPRSALEPEMVDAPLRRSRSARHPLVVIGNAIFSLFVLLAVVGIAALILGKQRFEMPGPLAADKIVNIPHGSGIRDIADVLQREGVIDQPWVFVGGVLVLKAREDLKAGEYQFAAHASLRDVVATIVDGKVISHQISLPEGLTSEQIVARLLQDDILTGNIKEIPREGSLLPDTYNFTRGISREQIIQRMQAAQQRLVKEVWDRHSPDLPLKTPDQLVVLASLVEKETAKPDERTRVAAVFVNRLKQRMRLQSDPTIIYGLVGGKGTLGRPIMKSEIDQPTPYNTYQIDGLPPGPICNPGRASLEAAANPARTRELYFVADGAGGHVFAENYDQHQKNVARLRSFETDLKDRAPADAGTPPQAAPAAAAAASPAPAAASPPAPHHTTTHRNPTTQSSQPAQPTH
jgi:peptidoglycan lytic transglycosylase G